MSDLHEIDKKPDNGCASALMILAGIAILSVIVTAFNNQKGSSSPQSDPQPSKLAEMIIKSAEEEAGKHIAKAGYSPGRANAIQVVSLYLQKALRDPTSPIVEWGKLEVVEGGQLRQYRWGLKFTLNAKNGFGGYTGPKECEAYFEDKKLTDVFIPK